MAGVAGVVVKRVAHVLRRSHGGIRRHVKTIATQPPDGWITAGVWGPPGLAGYFTGLDFHPTSLSDVMRHPPQADVIHAHGVTAGLVALRRRRPPVVVSLHVVIGGSGRTARSRTARGLARVIAARADAVVAVSRGAAAGVRDAEVIAPVFDPLPPARRSTDEVRRELGASPNDVVAVNVSRLEEGKGGELFVNAVEAAGCVGWLVGDGAERARLEALATGSRVKVLGYRDDVSDVLRGADVFATPSSSESYGIAVAEAIDAGLPVVAFRTGAIEELVGRAGIVVDPGDADAFVSALRTLTTDREMRDACAAAARAAMRPDSSSLIAAVGKVYDRVASTKARV